MHLQIKKLNHPYPIYIELLNMDFLWRPFPTGLSRSYNSRWRSKCKVRLYCWVSWLPDLELMKTSSMLDFSCYIYVKHFSCLCCYYCHWNIVHIWLLDLELRKQTLCWIFHVINMWRNFHAYVTTENHTLKISITSK